MPAGSTDDPRRDPTATAIEDGRVVVIGGESDDTFLATAEIWDPDA